ELFIEHRIYKRIEECETNEAVQQAVLRGLRPYRSQLTRDLTSEDVEMLLALQIKRISKFDLARNEEDKARIVQELKEVAKNLRGLTAYAIAYLQGLINKYQKNYKRRTQLTTAEEIDVRELTANELAIVYDREKGFLGSGIKGEASFRCSPLDRLLIVWENGRYQVLPPPEKMFVDKDVLHFGIYDRDRLFTMVYTTPKGAFLKRFNIGGAIMNRDYSCTQDGAKIKWLTAEPVKEVKLKYRQVQGAKTSEQSFELAKIPVRGARTRGLQVTKRTVTSVTAK
ncbi:MAG: DNA topoisomerase IV subunit A, partial [Verrucomicrobia bacterium]|nr:DNA topoisomerase IV subunit A [Verrucomicrobiota bacterium]